MSERSVEHATIVIERRYPASPERTFAAWADVAAKARWMGVSEGGLELDFRIGGEERHRGTLPDGHVYAYQAVYQDIVRPRRILYTYEMHLDDSRISISLATVEFTPEHDGTRLGLHRAGRLPRWLRAARPPRRGHGQPVGRAGQGATERAAGPLVPPWYRLHRLMRPGTSLAPTTRTSETRRDA